MEIHTVIVTYKQNNHLTPLAYKSKEGAERAYSSLRSRAGAMEVVDDFGMRVDMDLAAISTVSVVDFAKNLEGQAEAQIIKAHSDSRLNARLASDPLLKTAQVFRGNPQFLNG